MKRGAKDRCHPTPAALGSGGSLNEGPGDPQNSLCSDWHEEASRSSQPSWSREPWWTLAWTSSSQRASRRGIWHRWWAPGCFSESPWAWHLNPRRPVAINELPCFFGLRFPSSLPSRTPLSLPQAPPLLSFEKGESGGPLCICQTPCAMCDNEGCVRISQDE